MSQLSRIPAWVAQFVSHHKWLIFVLWALWLTIEYFGLGPFSYVFIHDCGDSVLPMRLGFVAEFREHGFNYWSGQAVCGFDRLAAMGPLFRIDSALFFALPGWLSYGLVVAIQRFLAGYFTYRVCKDCLELDDLPSLIAGLAYSLSFFYFQSEFAGEAGFPLVLWSIERAGNRGRLAGYAMAVVLGAFVLYSSGFALSVPFMLVMALAWFALLRRQRSPAFWGVFVAFVVVLLAGQVPTIWAMLVNSPISHRAGLPGEDSGILSALVSAFSDWHRGVFDRETLLLVWFGPAVGVVSLASARLRGRAVWSPTAAAAGLAVAVGLLGLLGIVVGARGLPVAVFVGVCLLAVCVLRPVDRVLLILLAMLGFCVVMTAVRVLVIRLNVLGFLTSFQFDRFYLLAPFFAAVALGYGLHVARQAGSEWRMGAFNFRPQAALCVAAIALCVVTSLGVKGVHCRSEWLGGSRYAAMYENPAVMSLAAGGDGDPFRVATVAHNLHPAYANACGLETADGYVALYSGRYKDYWGKVIEPLTSTDDSRYDYFHGWGSRVYLFAPSDGTFDRIGQVPFSEYYDLDLLGLANTRYLISDLPLFHESLRLVSSPGLEGESGTGQESEAAGSRLEGRRNLYIYENELCFPRFFVCDQVISFDGADEMLEAMAAAGSSGLRESVFAETDSMSGVDVERLGCSFSEATIERCSPDEVVLSVQSDGPVVLVASISYSPHWTCRVNGEDGEVFPAYCAFMGVFLEGGENRVELKYDAPYWTFR